MVDFKPPDFLSRQEICHVYYYMREKVAPCSDQFTDWYLKAMTSFSSQALANIFVASQEKLINPLEKDFHRFEVVLAQLYSLNTVTTSLENLLEFLNLGYEEALLSLPLKIIP